MLTTRLTTRFGIRHPVVLAPMDGTADARLTAAVSRAGGLGMLGGGYGDRSRLERELAELDSLDAPVGCGFITWSLARRPDLLDTVIEHDPAAVLLSFGDPMPFAARIRDAGVPLICQVSTMAHAHRALEAGSDVLVAQGGEGGGHGTGTRSTFTLVPDVADLIADAGSSALLVAAGGVADGRNLAAALALGADGVMVGTRFWACEEAPTSREAQKRALAASGDDTARSSVFDVVRARDWPQKYTGRVLRNAFLDRWHGREDGLRATIDGERAAFDAAVEAEDYETAVVIVGESVGRTHDVVPAATVVERMVEEAEAAITGVGGRAGL